MIDEDGDGRTAESKANLGLGPWGVMKRGDGGH